MLTTNNYSSFEGWIRVRTSRCENYEGQGVRAEEVRAKVIEDINFLRDRIAHIKRTKMATHNPIILNTYQSMLDSRIAVLEWLDDGDGELSAAK